MKVVSFFLRVFFSLFLFALAAAVFYVFETAIAASVVAFFVLFGLMYSYLKGHTVDIEEKRAPSAALLADDAYPAQPAKLKADPKVIALFQKVIEEKAQEKAAASKRSQAVSLSEKWLPHPPVQKRDAHLLREPETVKVSLSASAKKQPSEQANFFSSGAFAPSALRASSSDSLSLKGQPAAEKSIFDELVFDGVETPVHKSPFPTKPKKNREAFIEAARLEEEIAESDDEIFDELHKKSAAFEQTENQASVSEGKQPAQLSNRLLEDSADLAAFTPQPKIDTEFLQSGPVAADLLAQCQAVVDDQGCAKTIQQVENFLQLGKADLTVQLHGELLFQLGRLNLRLHKAEKARQILLDCFSKYIPQADPTYAQKLSEVVRSFCSGGHHRWALPFLLTHLSFLRQNKDYTTMNQLYREISCAYSELEDTPHLIESLQNHLAIKKHLNDYTGQLELLDQLGKIYFDGGDQKGASYCYEQSLQVRQKMLESSAL